MCGTPRVVAWGIRVYKCGLKSAGMRRSPHTPRDKRARMNCYV